MSNEVSEGMGIAVIGMAGRFPGAGSIGEFWDNLVSGKDVLTVFTDEELGQHVPAELLRRENYVKAGYVLDKVDGFDAAFFGYTPAEARSIDPQQRIFLECAWEAFEDAGHIPGREKSVGVFASITPSSYLPFDTSQFPGSEGRFFENLLGNDKDYAASRVAYKLDLKGPAFSVQSACSSSLVGICVAFDILSRQKAGDSYRVQEQDNTPESLRWVPASTRLPRGTRLGFRRNIPQCGEFYGCEPTPYSPRSHHLSTG